MRTELSFLKSSPYYHRLYWRLMTDPIFIAFVAPNDGYNFLIV